MTSETYAPDDQKRTMAGGVIITVVSLLATVLVIGGLIYGAGAHARNQAVLATFGCEPNLSPSGLPCTTIFQEERWYTAMTTPAIKQLNSDAIGYTTNEWHNLAGAEAALRAEATSANAFETSLAHFFRFGPAVAPKVRALMQAIASSVKLIDRQARSSSLTQMRSFNGRVQIAAATVESDLKLVHKALYTRPTAAQEP